MVGVASYFFEKFHFFWRIAIRVLSVALIFVGIALYPEEGEGVE